MPSPRKPAVLSAVRAALAQALETLVAVNASAVDEATRGDNRAENKYDTRGLEASYLASGQSERIVQLRQLVGFYDVFAPPALGDDHTVVSGALLQLEEEDRTWWALLTPRDGGLTVQVDGVDVVLISSTSPLGRALLGAAVDDEVSFPTPRGERSVVVVSLR